jgi:hypothetical protein
MPFLILSSTFSFKPSLVRTYTVHMYKSAETCKSVWKKYMWLFIVLLVIAFFLMVQ